VETDESLLALGMSFGDRQLIVTSDRLHDGFANGCIEDESPIVLDVVLIVGRSDACDILRRQDLP
jgi:hypothetical protein